MTTSPVDKLSRARSAPNGMGSCRSMSDYLSSPGGIPHA